jgi:serine/threonine protein kinase
MVFPYARADLAGVLSVPDFNLSLSQIKCLFKQLLHGLSGLHKRGLMHRDIKCMHTSTLFSLCIDVYYSCQLTHY